MAILRVNQIDPTTADALAGWGQFGDGYGARAIDAPWPQDVRAFELRIVPQEGDAPASESDLRGRVRRLVCEALAGLAPQGQSVVARLDGRLSGVLPAIAWAADKAIGISPVRHFNAADPSPAVSFRVAEFVDAAADLCHALGPALGHDVRLRAFTVPDELVGPLLDIDDVDDERWREILPRAGVTVDTIVGPAGLIVFTRLAPDDVTTALATRLAR